MVQGSFLNLKARKLGGGGGGVGGFGVWGLGFGVWGLGFGVWGLGFGVWGLGFGVWGLGFGGRRVFFGDKRSPAVILDFNVEVQLEERGWVLVGCPQLLRTFVLVPLATDTFGVGLDSLLMFGTFFRNVVGLHTKALVFWLLRVFLHFPSQGLLFFSPGGQAPK